MSHIPINLIEIKHYLIFLSKINIIIFFLIIVGYFIAILITDNWNYICYLDLCNFF